ncbi:type II toxin-antitoxin system CcdA family antitoxin [Sinorhizobium terangae]|uniref:Post-segregation antitoxin CcdA n=1 Tax=Sinorhizobium terangae TaxID=110322 RepID=A0A6N7LM52_SINTE|nr:type II toxin-antitoxin system CcdA family antitoxin [Sinorhizobium terangae]MBB4183583.1 antitoxin CcdA [Sinorhizobium terangae]MQX18716.1 post-segregation antitoxin CcdA [Sinorhizobium terangae]WFU47738.1 type II toxin-antitoxin system CcdA family antitoxin [Sinorhizobium terangae]
MTRSTARRPTNLSLDGDLLSKARDLKINVSRAAEEGIAQAIKTEREKLWRIENAKAITDANALVEKRGLPLAKHRQF